MDLATRLFDSCLFDEALNTLESGILRDPRELPTARQTAIVMTLAAYPLSHMGSQHVTNIAYTGIHRGVRDVQKTPGARAVDFLRRLIALSERDNDVKLLLRSALTEHKGDSFGSMPARRTYRVRTGEESGVFDEPGRIPSDRTLNFGMDSSLLRDVVSHDLQPPKTESDQLEPLLSYTRVSSLWMSLWAFYAYYLSCSGSMNSAQLSAWVTVKPLLVVIQDIIKADPVILKSFVERGTMVDICERLFPQRPESAFSPLFQTDSKFAYDFSVGILKQMREAAFIDSMDIRERWVAILLENLDDLQLGKDSTQLLLDSFTTFSGRHPQVIPHVYPCRYLPMYFTKFLVKLYLKCCQGETIEDSRSILGELDDECLIDSGDMLYGIKEALSDVPSRFIVDEKSPSMSTILFCFYSHAQLWLKLLLENEETDHDEVLDQLEEGQKARRQALRESGEYDTTVLRLCDQQETILRGLVEVRRNVKGDISK